MKPAYSTLKNLEREMNDLGVTWQTDPEISRSYEGYGYPLKYKLNYEEIKQFFRDFPQFNPQLGMKNKTDPGVQHGIVSCRKELLFY